MSLETRSSESSHLRKTVNLGMNVGRVHEILKFFDPLEESTAEVENFTQRLKNADSVTAAHELIYEMASSLASRLRGAKFAAGSGSTKEAKDLSQSVDEEYRKLEKELQKYENKVRNNIRVRAAEQNEQYLKVVIEGLERKVEGFRLEEVQHARELKVPLAHQALREELRAKNAELAKLKELTGMLSQEEDRYVLARKSPDQTLNPDPEEEYPRLTRLFKTVLGLPEKLDLVVAAHQEKKLSLKKQEGLPKSGDKGSSVLKKVAMMKDWKSTSKKTFKEAQVNSETKRESKKKPATASKETKEVRDLTLLSKHLSNKLFSGGVVAEKKAPKKLEKKKDKDVVTKASVNTDNSSSKKTSKIC